MNIIQIQDRLKGLPQDMLVNYVEQPKGEVPIYLALGELQRRKGMRERFQASQTPPPSVSEQVVAEAKPQQRGLGAMAPQPQPQMDPRQLAASGIAANPQSAVGGPAMMAKGGIVGYWDGGTIKDIGYGIWDLVNPVKKIKWINKLLKKRKSKKFKEDAKEGFGTKPKPKTTTTKTKTKTPKSDEVDLGRSYLPGGGGVDKTMWNLSKGILKLPYKNPVVAGGIYYAFSDEIKGLYDQWFNKDGSLKDKDNPPPPEVIEKIEDAAKEQEDPKFVTPQLDTGYDMSPEEYGQSRADAYRERIGTDPNLAKVASRLEELEGRAGDTRQNALNKALIMGGLTMAGGQSPNFLENLTKGAMGGVGAYGEEIEKAKDIEDKAFELDLAIGQAQRKEKVAIETFGMKSEEAEKARRDTRELENMKLELQRYGYETSKEVAEISSGMYGMGPKINEKINKEIAGNKNYQDAERLLTGLQHALDANPNDKDLQKRIQQTLQIMATIEARIKARYPVYGGNKSQNITSIGNIPDHIKSVIEDVYSGSNPKTDANPKTDVTEEDGFIDDIGEFAGDAWDWTGNVAKDISEDAVNLYDKGLGWLEGQKWFNQ